MSPPIEEWPAHQLPYRVHTTPDGRRRKGPDVDLTRCPLYEMVQYACEPETVGNSGKKVVRCQPIVRMFRKCEDFMAEVTTLEQLQKR